MYRTDKKRLSAEDVEIYLDDYLTNKVPRFKYLDDYYTGKHKILNAKKGTKIVNNKLVNPYPKYITDMQTGYFLGQPITYTAVDNDSINDDLLLEKLLQIYKLNDEQEHNLELGRTASKKGLSRELLYINEDKEIRMARLEPDESLIIYDTSIEDKKKFGIRFYKVEEFKNEVMYVELYDEKSIRYFKDEGKGLIETTGDKEIYHNFDGVPIITYKNNEECIGDYEPVISIIDEYDKVESDTANDMEQFTDAFLVLRNLAGTSKKDIIEAKEQKVLIVNEDGKAEWLIKNVNDTWVENFKDRLNSDIHKFSATPDLTDEKFGQNLSGVSLRYKLLAMEQLRSTKERKFKKGLQERIRLITSVLKKADIRFKDAEDLYTSIDIKFNNTLPQNTKEIAEIINILSPYVSMETLIELLPFIENANEDLKKKENEEKRQEDNFDTLNDYFLNLKKEDDINESVLEK